MIKDALFARLRCRLAASDQRPTNTITPTGLHRSFRRVASSPSMYTDRYTGVKMPHRSSASSVSGAVFGRQMAGRHAFAGNRFVVLALARIGRPQLSQIAHCRRSKR